MKLQSKFLHFHSWKCISKCRQENDGHLVSASMCWLVWMCGFCFLKVSWRFWDNVLQHLLNFCINPFCAEFILLNIKSYLHIQSFLNMEMAWVDNTQRSRQNGGHFVDASFRCIFLNENDCILIEFLLKFIAKGPIDNTSELVEVMAWHQTGNQPLPQPMMTKYTDAYVRHLSSVS